MWGIGQGGRKGFRLRCKMDSYIFMNSARKVKRKQYDNLAVIAFFPPTVFGRAERRSLRCVTGTAISRSVTAVHSGYTLTLYLTPVNLRWGQVVVMPNPLDSWVMGQLSLVRGWSIICLIKQDRHQIIELLMELSKSYSSHSGRSQLKSYYIVWRHEILMSVNIKYSPFIYLTDVLTFD